jgi:dolichyl-phosphate-mannose--protein O-mannosyl transferase
LYLSWGGVFFDSLKEGDLNNPCIKNIGGCELLYDEEGQNEISYTPIRNFFVGFSQYLTTGENKGDFYHWSCIWTPRLFSTIFGSLTIVVIFFIGKILFNRTIGLFSSLTLLFLSLWTVNSRLIMSEVYLYFFILLSILFLLKSFKKENKHRMLFFILGAISFGFALNVKPIAFQMIIPLKLSL